MKKFEEREIAAALAYVAAGGQALHIFNRSGAFDHMAKVAVFRFNHPWAHLFDADLVRLRATARRLGVRVIRVGRQGGRGQHVDLCGKPLERALLLCQD